MNITGRGGNHITQNLGGFLVPRTKGFVCRTLPETRLQRDLLEREQAPITSEKEITVELSINKKKIGKNC